MNFTKNWDLKNGDTSFEWISVKRFLGSRPGY